MPRRSLLLDLHGYSGRLEAEPPTCTGYPGDCVVTLLSADAPTRASRLAGRHKLSRAIVAGAATRKIRCVLWRAGSREFGANGGSERRGRLKAGPKADEEGAGSSVVEASNGSCNLARNHGAGAGLALLRDRSWRCGPAGDAGCRTERLGTAELNAVVDGKKEKEGERVCV